MDTRKAFGQVLRMTRKRRGISQEALGDVTSRTYISSLERGLNSPTLEKIDQIAAELGVHALTLIAATFARRDRKSVEEVLERVKIELKALDSKDA